VPPPLDGLDGTKPFRICPASPPKTAINVFVLLALAFVAATPRYVCPFVADCATFPATVCPFIVTLLLLINCAVCAWRYAPYADAADERRVCSVAAVFASIVGALEVDPPALERIKKNNTITTARATHTHLFVPVDSIGYFAPPGALGVNDPAL
jgi:hypothetical protein